MNGKTRKLKLITIEVSEEQQIIPIDFKLANDIDSCNGIFIGVKEFLNTSSNSIPQIGELSLIFNAKKQHIVHTNSEYTKNPFHKKEFLKLDCQIEPNTNITGFYLDYGKTKNRENRFLPHTLVIYLSCISSQKEQ